MGFPPKVLRKFVYPDLNVVYCTHAVQPYDTMNIYNFYIKMCLNKGSRNERLQNMQKQRAKCVSEKEMQDFL